MLLCCRFIFSISFILHRFVLNMLYVALSLHIASISLRLIQNHSTPSFSLVFVILLFFLLLRAKLLLFCKRIITESSIHGMCVCMYECVCLNVSVCVCVCVCLIYNYFMSFTLLNRHRLLLDRRTWETALYADIAQVLMGVCISPTIRDEETVSWFLMSATDMCLPIQDCKVMLY